MKKVASKKHCVWFLKTLAAAIDVSDFDALAVSLASGRHGVSSTALVAEDQQWLQQLVSLCQHKTFPWLEECWRPVVLLWLQQLQSTQLELSSQESAACWDYLQRTDVSAEIVRRAKLLHLYWQRAAEASSNRFQKKLRDVLLTIGHHDLFEWLLATVQPQQKKHLRYYATPIEVADTMIRMVDHSCRANDGVGILGEPNSGNLPTIIDPAAGSCVFVRRLLQYLRNDHNDRQRWIGQSVLPRVRAIEIDPLAAVVGNLLVTIELQALGLDLATLPVWQVTVGDALDLRFAKPGYRVIIGNPPYAALTTATNRWTEELLNGEVDGVSYRSLPDETVGSRKHWLHDDYIKFIRVGHFWLAQAESGVMCLVTNRAFLDSPGCQVLRRQLMAGTDDCCLVDLQGSARDIARESRKANEAFNRQPVFEIGSGVAIGMFARWNDQNQSKESGSLGPNSLPAKKTKTFRYQKLQGNRQQKFEQLKSLQFEEATFLPPLYHWIPVGCDQETWNEYQRGYSLEDIFQQFWSAIVTARDRVVIDVDREALLQRLNILADPAVSDDDVRDRFFYRSRSKRYQAGDTRSWRLSEARQRLREGLPLGAKVIPCLFRAMDQHWIYYDPSWLDWPRQKDVQGLLDSNSIALVARKMSPIEKNYRYVAVTRKPVIDGALRSDNRGSESVFNLYRRDGKPNLRSDLIQFLATKFRLQYQANEIDLQSRQRVFGKQDRQLLELFDERVLTAEMIFCWIYDAICRPGYQKRFATLLATGFPRVSFPKCKDEARAMLISGQQRVALELDFDPSSAAISGDTSEPKWLNQDFEIQRKQIRYQESLRTLFINETNGVSGIEPELWQYQQGTHFILEKWLKNRSATVLVQRQRALLLTRIQQLRGLVRWEESVEHQS